MSTVLCTLKVIFSNSNNFHFDVHYSIVYFFKSSFKTRYSNSILITGNSIILCPNFFTLIGKIAEKWEIGTLHSDLRENRACFQILAREKGPAKSYALLFNVRYTFMLYLLCQNMLKLYSQIT